MSEPEMTNRELKVFIDGRLEKTDLNIEHLDETFKSDFKRIEDQLKEMNHFLQGNGGKTGLKIQVDRLETSKKQFFGVVSVLAIGAVNHYFNLIEKVASRFNN